MDNYIEDFKANCEIYLRSQVIDMPESKSNNQREYDFNRLLRNRIGEVKKQLERDRDNLTTNASKRGFREINHLTEKLNNIIIDKLRNFQRNQEDRLN